MSYRLLIEHIVEIDEKFREFLKPGDVVRGEPYKLTLTAINLGDIRFPGGLAKELKVRYNVAAVSGAQTVVAREVRCSPLEPNETAVLYSGSFTALADGLASISVKLEAEDKKPIEYYQNPNFPLGTDGWIAFFYVANREQLLASMLLQKLLEKS